MPDTANGQSRSACDQKNFRVEWGTGYIDVSIGAFFTKANMNQVKKLFRLARQYSTEADRTELLVALAHADKERKALLDALGELAYKRAELANSFYGTTYKPVQGRAKKRIIQERAKLSRNIHILTNERWGT